MKTEIINLKTDEGADRFNELMAWAPGEPNNPARQDTIQTANPHQTFLAMELSDGSHIIEDWKNGIALHCPRGFDAIRFAKRQVGPITFAPSHWAEEPPTMKKFGPHKRLAAEADTDRSYALIDDNYLTMAITRCLLKDEIKRYIYNLPKRFSNRKEILERVREDYPKYIRRDVKGYIDGLDESRLEDLVGRVHDAIDDWGQLS